MLWLSKPQTKWQAVCLSGVLTVAPCALAGKIEPVRVTWAGYTSRSILLTMTDEDSPTNLFSPAQRLSWARWVRLPDNVNFDGSLGPAPSFVPDNWLPESWASSFREAELPEYHHVLFGAGTNGERESVLAVNRRGADSPWVLGGSLEHLGSNGEVHNMFLEDDGAAREASQFRLHLAWLDENWFTGLEAARRHLRRGDDWVRWFELPQRVRNTDVVGYDKTTADGAHWFWHGHWGSGGTLRLDSEYTEATRNILQDVDGNPARVEMFGLQSELTKWAHRAQLDYVWASGGVSGLDISWQEEQIQESSLNWGLLLPSLPLEQVFLGFLSDQTTTRKASVVYHQWQVKDDLTARVSWQTVDWSYDRKEADKASVPGLLPDDSLFRAAASEGQFDAELWQLGLNWQYSEHSALQLELAETYAPGGVSYNLVTGLRSPFRPETGNRIELKYVFEPLPWSHQLSVWREVVDDKQILVFARIENPYSSLIINVPQGFIQGISYEGGWHSENTDVVWSFVWQDSGFSNLGPGFRRLRDREWPLSPARQFQFLVNHRFSDRWSFGVEVQSMSAQWLDVQSPSEDKLPEWTSIGGKLRYERGAWAVELWGTNLTDAIIYRYRSIGSNTAMVADGRQIGIRVEWTREKTQ